MMDYEIDVVPGVRATQRRLVIVPDIASFWETEEPKWSADGIQRIMDLCDLQHRQAGRVVPIISGSPIYLHGDLQHQDAGFKSAWQEWLDRYNQTSGLGPAYASLMMRGAKSFVQPGVGKRQYYRIAAKIFEGRHHFPLRLKLDQAWLRLLRNARMMPEFILRNAADFTSRASLADAFRDGLISAAHQRAKLQGHYIQEVVIVTGYADSVRARAFRVPMA